MRSSGMNSNTNAFEAQVAALSAKLAPKIMNQHVAAVSLINLPGSQPPWRGTGIQVARGQAFSLFASGRIQWSAQMPERHGGPKFHLWARITPGGQIMNLTQNTGSFIADVDGELELGIYMGMWKNAGGELATPTKLYARLSGSLTCWVVAWRNDPASGLAALVRLQPDSWFLTAEMVRYASPIQKPAGWKYLIETGEADIFTSSHTESTPAIELDADDDQGIITTPIEIALNPSTTLSWRWRAETLPSEVAENTVHTHDYFSIATEFDNGRDLTWIWSASLAPETHFDCPIRAWTPRETHLVVRSGTADLGVWHCERRNVYQDVASAMGPPPRKIIRVWLIAVTSFQHRRARASFANIVLANDLGGATVL